MIIAFQFSIYYILERNKIKYHGKCADMADKVGNLISPEVNLEKQSTKDSRSAFWNLPVVLQVLVYGNISCLHICRLFSCFVICISVTCYFTSLIIWPFIFLIQEKFCSLYQVKESHSFFCLNFSFVLIIDT